MLLIFSITPEALAARKAKGGKLGRPKGLGHSRLDPDREEILRLLQEGVPKTRVAHKFKVHELTLHHLLKKHKLMKKERPPEEHIEASGPNDSKLTV